MAQVLSRKSNVNMLGMGLLAIVALAFKPHVDPLPWLIWNASNSVPKGLYFVVNHAPRIGEIAVLKLPDWAAILADQRNYLPLNARLLKPVAASGGDIVCRFGLHVFVNGKLIATALKQDKLERDMPVWKGCKRLCVTEIFVLSKHRDSFDSSYFGPVSIDRVIGMAEPLIILGK